MRGALGPSRGHPSLGGLTGLLVWSQQEIAEEKWPGQGMRLSGLEPASRSISHTGGGCPQPGPETPSLLSQALRPVPAWSPLALGEALSSQTATVLVRAVAGQATQTSLLHGFQWTELNTTNQYRLTHCWQTGPLRPWAT